MQLTTARLGTTFSIRGYDAAPLTGLIFDSATTKSYGTDNCQLFSTNIRLNTFFGAHSKLSYSAYHISQLYRAMLREVSIHPSSVRDYGTICHRDMLYRKNVGFLKAKIWITLRPERSYQYDCLRQTIHSLTTRLETLH